MLIKITETLVKYVEVEANGKCEALNKADDLYRAANDDFILSADNFDNVKFEVVND